MPSKLSVVPGDVEPHVRLSSVEVCAVFCVGITVLSLLIWYCVDRTNMANSSTSPLAANLPTTAIPYGQSRKTKCQPLYPKVFLLEHHLETFYYLLLLLKKKMLVNEEG